MLLSIYNSLDRDVDKLDDKSLGAEWIELGFQGEDPTTDFRGTGLLGLLNLHFFVSADPEKSKQILEEANDKRHHYFFACAGINITYKLLFMLAEERIDIFNFDKCGDKDEALHKFNLLYSKFFEDFHNFWLDSELRVSIMNFNLVLNNFCEQYKKSSF